MPRRYCCLWARWLYESSIRIRQAALLLPGFMIQCAENEKGELIVKKRSCWMIIVLFILCLAGTAGCGPAGGETADVAAGDGQDAENADQELQPVTTYGYEDVEGCWYSQSPEGMTYLMRIYRGSAEEERGTLVMECLDVPEFSYYGYIGLFPHTDEEGVAETYCSIQISLVNDERVDESHPDNIYVGQLLENGAFRFIKPGYINEDGEFVQGEGLDLIFTHQFPMPSYAVDYESGCLSGFWYASHEEEDVFLMAREDGHFLLWQEESLVSGIWRLDNNTLSLTCEMVDGESYTDADAVISTSIQENGDIDFGGVSLKAISGKHVGAYNAAVANKQGGEDPYHLDLFADGSFHFYAEYQDTGNSRDVVGICLYRSDTEADLMYLVMNGSTDIRTPASITVNSDGTLLMKHGDAEILFTEER